MTVFLLLGSNLGDRLGLLEKARQLIGTRVGNIVRQSACYETAAWGNETLSAFINQVVAVETLQSPQEVLALSLAIERELGRVRDEKWAARTIDIDLLFFGNEVIADKNLVVPHPQMHLRRFTLAPLAEIAPDVIHPVLNKTIAELLTELEDPLGVIVLN